MNFIPSGFGRSSAAAAPWQRPEVIRPPVPIETLLRLSHLADPGAAARTEAVAAFDAANREALSFGNQHELLNLYKTSEELRYQSHGAAQRQLVAVNVYSTRQAEFEEPLGTRLAAWGLNLASMGAIALGAVSTDVLIVQSGQFDGLTLLTAAPLSGIAVLSLVGLPLVSYAGIQDAAAAARFIRRIVRIGVTLGIGWIGCLALSTSIDTYITDMAGHAARGLVENLMMTTLPAVHAVATAALAPCQIGAEAAGSIGLKILAGWMQHRSRKRIAVRNPAFDHYDDLKEPVTAHLDWLNDALGKLDALQAELTSSRASFILECEAAMQRIQHQQKHAADGARLDVTRTDYATKPRPTQGKVA